MNETILTPRQRLIINLISQADGVSSKQIEEQLTNKYPSSKPTVARDLTILAKNKLIRAQGSARNTLYFSYNPNPLLKYFDLDQYFTTDPDKREGVKTQFNFSVLADLHNIFSLDEIKQIVSRRLSFKIESQKLDKTIYLKELERFMIELSWKSSKIEGNTYDLLSTEVLIKQGIEAKGHPKSEAIMILNHKRAFESILTHPSDFKKISLSQILQLHNFLTVGLEIVTGVRKTAVGITGTTYKPLDNQWQIKEALEKLITVVNNIEFPLGKALVIVAMISYLQPFTDGNKRTARMLANAVLLANDYFPLSYRSVDEGDFKKAVVLFYEQNSLYYLKQIIIDQYKFATENYFL